MSEKGFTESTNAFEEWIPDHLVLGPGGTKTFSTLGAMLKLDEIGFFKEVHTFVGVSAGAIIQSLYVSGYTIREIISEVAGTNLFQDIAQIDIFKVKTNNGLIPNNTVRDKLVQLFKAKFGFVPTFEELFKLTGLNLVTVTMNLDTREGVEYMNYETEPHLSIVTAIMLSMNVPFFFYQLNYKDCTYVDGALGNPYPVDRYDFGENRIMGIYIETKNHTKTNSSTSLYWARTIQATMHQIKWRILKNSSHRCKHLELSCKTMDTLGLTITAMDKATMIFSGIREAEKFIETLRTGIKSEQESSEEFSEEEEKTKKEGKILRRTEAKPLPSQISRLYVK